MQNVRAKKHLGQHFLNDEEIALRIVDSCTKFNTCKDVIEIGPGMGVLTKTLLLHPEFNTWVVEIDKESVEYLNKNYPKLSSRIISEDFLQLHIEKHIQTPFAIIGNFPYNISSQILFRLIDYRDQCPLLVGMFQKEVAVRIASGPGNKDYGILSVLLQAYYDIEYLFTVDEHVFTPPPKVKSGVIRLVRNNVKEFPCDEKKFKMVVKQGFNQRRKTLRNALKGLNFKEEAKDHIFFTKRAEQLSVKDFIELTLMLNQ